MRSQPCLNVNKSYNGQDATQVCHDYNRNYLLKEKKIIIADEIIIALVVNVTLDFTV